MSMSTGTDLLVSMSITRFNQCRISRCRYLIFNCCSLDIGANLTDPMYQGEYNGGRKHEPDLDKVLSRAWGVGVEKIFITAGSHQDARDSVKLAQTNGKVSLSHLKLVVSM